MSSPSVQVFPTCWSSTAFPNVQVVTALRDSTSPEYCELRSKLSCSEDLQSFTVRSADEVTKLLLSALQLRAILCIATLRRGILLAYWNSTHDGTDMRRVRDFSDSIAGLSVVDEDLGIRANASEVVARRRVPNVLYKLRVGLDGLWQKRSIEVTGERTL